MGWQEQLERIIEDSTDGDPQHAEILIGLVVRGWELPTREERARYAKQIMSNKGYRLVDERRGLLETRLRFERAG